VASELLIRGDRVFEALYALSQVKLAFTLPLSMRELTGITRGRDPKLLPMKLLINRLLPIIYEISLELTADQKTPFLSGLSESPL